ncbi:MAG: GNAT family N-acetyltransferase [Desulfobacteraceae bacterium]|nr:MAG: GNAT family N-acetyltransferase [Desulfobacteraceae bacterium]
MSRHEDTNRPSRILSVFFQSQCLCGRSSLQDCREVSPQDSKLWSEVVSGPSSGKRYPSDLETRRTTKAGVEIFLRPIRSGDEPPYKAFLQSLSSRSIYLKFFRTIQPTDDLVERMADVDYVHRMTILAFRAGEGEKSILGMARYILNPDERTAEVYFAVRDDHQNLGIGRELLSYLILVARKQGVQGFTAQVVVDNRRMLHLFRALEGREFKINRRMEAGVFHLDMEFL